MCGHTRNLIDGVAAGYQLTTVGVFKLFPPFTRRLLEKRSVRIGGVVNMRRSRYVETVGNTVYSSSQRHDVYVLKRTSFENVIKGCYKEGPVKFAGGIYLPVCSARRNKQAPE